LSFWNGPRQIISDTRISWGCATTRTREVWSKKTLGESWQGGELDPLSRTRDSQYLPYFISLSDLPRAPVPVKPPPKILQLHLVFNRYVCHTDLHRVQPLRYACDPIVAAERGKPKR
jgi:hypothetical protein